MWTIMIKDYGVVEKEYESNFRVSSINAKMILVIKNSETIGCFIRKTAHYYPWTSWKSLGELTTLFIPATMRILFTPLFKLSIIPVLFYHHPHRFLRLLF